MKIVKNNSTLLIIVYVFACSCKQIDLLEKGFWNLKSDMETCSIYFYSKNVQCGQIKLWL